MQSVFHSIAGMLLTTACTVHWAFSAYAQGNSVDSIFASDLQITSLESIPSSQVAQQSISANPSDAGSCRIKYVGVGGTFGLSDEGGTPLGEGGFSIVGRISVTENISFHTSSVFGDEGLLSVALTGGSPIRNQATGRTLFCPFLGAGITVETEEFDTVDPQAIVGVDVPLGSTVTGTARVNTTFADDGTDVGATIGVGIDIFELIR